MTISEAARKARVGKETIRFYEREGLIAQPRKPLEGYRRYEEMHVERIRFVKQCQSFGFSLAEAKDLLELLDTGHATCERACTLARRKIVELEKKVNEYQKLATQLSALLERPGLGSGLRSCSVIAGLRGERDATDATDVGTLGLLGNQDV